MRSQSIVACPWISTSCPWPAPLPTYFTRHSPGTGAGGNPSSARTGALVTSQTVTATAYATIRLQATDISHTSLAAVVAELEPNGAEISVRPWFTPNNKIRDGIRVRDQDLCFLAVSATDSAAGGSSKTDSQPVRA